MIHMYSIPKGMAAYGPWKDQCQRSNYYGRMERSVMEMSDNRSSKVIGKIRKACQLPKRQTYNEIWFLDLISFVARQRFRVPAQADDTKRMIEETLPWLVKAAGRLETGSGFTVRHYSLTQPFDAPPSFFVKSSHHQPPTRRLLHHAHHPERRRAHR